MSDEDISLDEKRVFEGRRGTSVAFVASGLGLARVEISDDQIGRFGLIHREETRSVAADTHEGNVAIATATDVLVGDGDEFERTDFGPAVAVAFADGLLAADADGRIARRDGADGEWATVGTVEGSVVAMDGDLAATDARIYRIDDAELASIGLGDEGGDGDGDDDGDGGTVRDVAAPPDGGTPGAFAAASGIHRRLSDGWHLEVSGDATAVATGGADGGAVAVVDDAVLIRSADGCADSGRGDGGRGDGTWADANCPATEGIADVATGRSNYAITADGTLFVDPPTAKDGTEGWASRSLGLRNVGGIVAFESSNR